MVVYHHFLKNTFHQAVTHWKQNTTHCKNHRSLINKRSPYAIIALVIKMIRKLHGFFIKSS